MSDVEKTRMQFTVKDVMFEADIYNIDLVGPEEEGEDATLNFEYDVVTPIPEDLGITKEDVADQIGKVLVAVLENFIAQQEETNEQN